MFVIPPAAVKSCEQRWFQLILEPSAVMGPNERLDRFRWLVEAQRRAIAEHWEGRRTADAAEDVAEAEEAALRRWALAYHGDGENTRRGGDTSTAAPSHSHSQRRIATQLARSVDDALFPLLSSSETMAFLLANNAPHHNHCQNDPPHHNHGRHLPFAIDASLLSPQIRHTVRSKVLSVEIGMAPEERGGKGKTKGSATVKGVKTKFNCWVEVPLPSDGGDRQSHGASEMMTVDDDHRWSRGSRREGGGRGGGKSIDSMVASWQQQRFVGTHWRSVRLRVEVSVSVAPKIIAPAALPSTDDEVLMGGASQRRQQRRRERELSKQQLSQTCELGFAVRIASVYVEENTPTKERDSYDFSRNRRFVGDEEEEKQRKQIVSQLADTLYVLDDDASVAMRRREPLHRRHRSPSLSSESESLSSSFSFSNTDEDGDEADDQNRSHTAAEEKRRRERKRAAPPAGFDDPFVAAPQPSSEAGHDETKGALCGTLGRRRRRRWTRVREGLVGLWLEQQQSSRENGGEERHDSYAGEGFSPLDNSHQQQYGAPPPPLPTTQTAAMQQYLRLQEAAAWEAGVVSQATAALRDDVALVSLSTVLSFYQNWGCNKPSSCSRAIGGNNNEADHSKRTDTNGVLRHVACPLALAAAVGDAEATETLLKTITTAAFSSSPAADGATAFSQNNSSSGERQSKPPFARGTTSVFPIGNDSATAMILRTSPFAFIGGGREGETKRRSAVTPTHRFVVSVLERGLRSALQSAAVNPPQNSNSQQFHNPSSFSPSNAAAMVVSMLCQVRSYAKRLAPFCCLAIGDEDPITLIRHAHHMDSLEAGLCSSVAAMKKKASNFRRQRRRQQDNSEEDSRPSSVDPSSLSSTSHVSRATAEYVALDLLTNQSVALVAEEQIRSIFGLFSSASSGDDNNAVQQASSNNSRGQMRGSGDNVSGLNEMAAVAAKPTLSYVEKLEAFVAARDAAAAAREQDEGEGDGAAIGVGSKTTNRKGKIDPIISIFTHRNEDDLISALVHAAEAIARGALQFDASDTTGFEEGHTTNAVVAAAAGIVNKCISTTVAVPNPNLPFLPALLTGMLSHHATNKDDKRGGWDNDRNGNGNETSTTQTAKGDQRAAKRAAAKERSRDSEAKAATIRAAYNSIVSQIMPPLPSIEEHHHRRSREQRDTKMDDIIDKGVLSSSLLVRFARRVVAEQCCTLLHTQQQDSRAAGEGAVAEVGGNEADKSPLANGDDGGECSGDGTDNSTTVLHFIIRRRYHRCLALVLSWLRGGAAFSSVSPHSSSSSFLLDRYDGRSMTPLGLALSIGDETAQSLLLFPELTEEGCEALLGNGGGEALSVSMRDEKMRCSAGDHAVVSSLLKPFLSPRLSSEQTFSRSSDSNTHQWVSPLEFLRDGVMSSFTLFVESLSPTVLPSTSHRLSAPRSSSASPRRASSLRRMSSSSSSSPPHVSPARRAAAAHPSSGSSSFVSTSAPTSSAHLLLPYPSALHSALLDAFSPSWMRIAHNALATWVRSEETKAESVKRKRKKEGSKGASDEKGRQFCGVSGGDGYSFFLFESPLLAGKAIDPTAVAPFMRSLKEASEKGGEEEDGQQQQQQNGQQAAVDASLHHPLILVNHPSWRSVMALQSLLSGGGKRNESTTEEVEGVTEEVNAVDGLSSPNPSVFVGVMPQIAEKDRIMTNLVTAEKERRIRQQRNADGSDAVVAAPTTTAAAEREERVVQRPKGWEAVAFAATSSSGAADPEDRGNSHITLPREKLLPPPKISIFPFDSFLNSSTSDNNTTVSQAKGEGEKEGKAVSTAGSVHRLPFAESLSYAVVAAVQRSATSRLVPSSSIAGVSSVPNPNHPTAAGRAAHGKEEGDGKDEAWEANEASVLRGLFKQMMARDRTAVAAKKKKTVAEMDDIASRSPRGMAMAGPDSSGSPSPPQSPLQRLITRHEEAARNKERMRLLGEGKSSPFSSSSPAPPQQSPTRSAAARVLRVMTLVEQSAESDAAAAAERTLSRFFAGLCAIAASASASRSVGGVGSFAGGDPFAAGYTLESIIGKGSDDDVAVVAPPSHLHLHPQQQQQQPPLPALWKGLAALLLHFAASVPPLSDESLNGSSSAAAANTTSANEEAEALHLASHLATAQRLLDDMMMIKASTAPLMMFATSAEISMTVGGRGGSEGVGRSEGDGSSQNRPLITKSALAAIASVVARLETAAAPAGEAAKAAAVRRRSKALFALAAEEAKREARAKEAKERIRQLHEARQRGVGGREGKRDGSVVFNFDLSDGDGEEEREAKHANNSSLSPSSRGFQQRRASASTAASTAAGLLLSPAADEPPRPSGAPHTVRVGPHRNRSASAAGIRSGSLQHRSSSATSVATSTLPLRSRSQQSLQSRRSFSSPATRGRGGGGNSSSSVVSGGLGLGRDMGIATNDTSRFKKSTFYAQLIERERAKKAAAEEEAKAKKELMLRQRALRMRPSGGASLSTTAAADSAGAVARREGLRSASASSFHQPPPINAPFQSTSLANDASSAVAASYAPQSPIAATSSPSRVRAHSSPPSVGITDTNDGQYSAQYSPAARPGHHMFRDANDRGDDIAATTTIIAPTTATPLPPHFPQCPIAIDADTAQIIVFVDDIGLWAAVPPPPSAVLSVLEACLDAKRAKEEKEKEKDHHVCAAAANGDAGNGNDDDAWMHSYRNRAHPTSTAQHKHTDATGGHHATMRALFPTSDAEQQNKKRDNNEAVEGQSTTQKETAPPSTAHHGGRTEVAPSTIAVAAVRQHLKGSKKETGPKVANDDDTSSEDESQSQESDDTNEHISDTLSSAESLLAAFFHPEFDLLTFASSSSSSAHCDGPSLHSGPRYYRGVGGGESVLRGGGEVAEVSPHPRGGRSFSDADTTITVRFDSPLKAVLSPCSPIVGSSPFQNRHRSTGRRGRNNSGRGGLRGAHAANTSAAGVTSSTIRIGAVVEWLRSAREAYLASLSFGAVLSAAPPPPPAASSSSSACGLGVRLLLLSHSAAPHPHVEKNSSCLFAAQPSSNNGIECRQPILEVTISSASTPAPPKSTRGPSSASSTSFIIREGDVITFELTEGASFNNEEEKRIIADPSDQQSPTPLYDSLFLSAMEVEEVAASPVTAVGGARDITSPAADAAPVAAVRAPPSRRFRLASTRTTTAAEGVGPAETYASSGYIHESKMRLLISADEKRNSSSLPPQQIHLPTLRTVAVGAAIPSVLPNENENSIAHSAPSRHFTPSLHHLRVPQHRYYSRDEEEGECSANSGGGSGPTFSSRAALARRDAFHWWRRVLASGWQQHQ